MMTPGGASKHVHKLLYEVLPLRQSASRGGSARTPRCLEARSTRPPVAMTTAILRCAESERSHDSNQCTTRVRAAVFASHFNSATRVDGPENALRGEREEGEIGEEEVLLEYEVRSRLWTSDELHWLAHFIPRLTKNLPSFAKYPRRGIKWSTQRQAATTAAPKRAPVTPRYTIAMLFAPPLDNPFVAMLRCFFRVTGMDEGADNSQGPVPCQDRNEER
ncbi:hypothetical protein FI667_g9406, partial [Globisporangium splendens]